MRNECFYGIYGGYYVPELLVPVLHELDDAFEKFKNNLEFNNELNKLLERFAGRPTPLLLCENIYEEYGVKVYLKREDLLHGGAHKTNQVIAQALLTLRMGKSRIIAETGAGQHGVACAICAAKLGLQCTIYMGETDYKRQSSNVMRMTMMGATVIPVTQGAGTLKDACNEALRDWSSSYPNTHYIVGTVAGPFPFPKIVKHFQRIIGDEAREQILQDEGRLPDEVVACIGGGSNAIGIFSAFINDKKVQLIGIEPAGKGLDGQAHGAPLWASQIGIFFGMKSYVMQDKCGQIQESYSISAGLDFPSVGPEHAQLKDSGRVKYLSANDDEAINSYKKLSNKEGIIPALESSHALARIFSNRISDNKKDKIILVNLSGRGDKDLEIVASYDSKKEGYDVK